MTFAATGQAIFHSLIECSLAMTIKRTSGQGSGLNYSVDGILEWQTGTESSQGNYNFNRYSAGGALLDTPLAIAKSTGNVTIPLLFTASGAKISYYADSGGNAVAIGGCGANRTLRVRDNTIYFHVGGTWDVECENSTAYFVRTSDTQLQLRMRGADGTVRAISFTLA
jgi:hypothetical protein